MRPPEGMTVHLFPPNGEAVCPCCGKTPFELPRTDRITVHVEMATCTTRIAELEAHIAADDGVIR